MAFWGRFFKWGTLLIILAAVFLGVALFTGLPNLPERLAPAPLRSPTILSGPATASAPVPALATAPAVATLPPPSTPVRAAVVVQKATPASAEAGQPMTPTTAGTAAERPSTRESDDIGSATDAAAAATASPIMPATPAAIATTSLLPPAPAATTTIAPDSAQNKEAATVPAPTALTSPATSTQESPSDTGTLLTTAPDPLAPPPLAQLPDSATPITAQTLTGPGAETVPAEPITATTSAEAVVPATPTVTPIPVRFGAADNSQPLTLTAADLYAAPDAAAPVIGRAVPGQFLDIIAWHTTGTWYLLADGAWILAADVQNAPLNLPLVIPTATPGATATATPTPVLPPTSAPLVLATPVPLPTSLEDPVCDCTADRYDCLGSSVVVQPTAQACFEYCFRVTGRDVHNLDPNGNGIACENLP